MVIIALESFVTPGDQMELEVPDRKLREALEDFASAKRQYGQDMAKKLHLRRDALRAALSLADFWPPKKKPERVHELIGNLKGLFSIDLKQPKRLLFKPLEDPSPTKPARTERGGSAVALPAGKVTQSATPSPPLISQAAPSDNEYERWKSIKKVEVLRVDDTHG